MLWFFIVCTPTTMSPLKIGTFVTSLCIPQVQLDDWLMEGSAEERRKKEYSTRRSDHTALLLRSPGTPHHREDLPPQQSIPTHPWLGLRCCLYSFQPLCTSPFVHLRSQVCCAPLLSLSSLSHSHQRAFSLSGPCLEYLFPTSSLGANAAPQIPI